MFYSGENSVEVGRSLEGLDSDTALGCTPIQCTTGGRTIDLDQVYRRYDRDVGNQVARIVSAWYAQGASGQVAAFCLNSDPEVSIFRTVELPLLVENDRVTHVNGIAREELAHLHAMSPDRAFKKLEEKLPRLQDNLREMVSRQAEALREQERILDLGGHERQ